MFDDRYGAFLSSHLYFRDDINIIVCDSLCHNEVHVHVIYCTDLGPTGHKIYKIYMRDLFTYGKDEHVLVHHIIILM